MSLIEECPETDEEFLEQVHRLLEQLNAHSSQVNSLSKERTELCDQLMRILLSLRLPNGLSISTEKQLEELKLLSEEMSNAQKKHLASIGDLQEAMRLVERVECRYEAGDSIQTPTRQSLIELIDQLGEMYFVCLGRQQQALARCRQLECALSGQKQIPSETSGQQQWQVCQQSGTKVSMRNVELRLKMIEIEMEESRRNYRKTMHSLERLNEQMHQTRDVMARLERRQRVLTTSAAASLLATHNHLLHTNAVLVLLFGSLRKAKTAE